MILLIVTCFWKEQVSGANPELGVKDIEAALRGAVNVAPGSDQMARLSEGFRANPKEVKYVPIGWLLPSQDRISFLRMLQKAKEIFAQQHLKWVGGKVQGKIVYDNGKSILSPELAVPVVLLPDGIAITDKHHETGVGWLSRTETLPIVVHRDLSHMDSNAEAFREIAKSEQGYFFDFGGEVELSPVPISQLKDDPNRYMMSVLAKKVEIVEENGGKSLKPEHPFKKAWVKVGVGVPCIEFKLADICYKYGIVYDPKWGDDIPAKVVAQIRQVFLREREQPGKEFLKTVPLVLKDEGSKNPERDPNEHLVRKILRKIVTRRNGAEFKKTTGAKHPVVVALKKDSPEAVLELALALYANGINYREDGSEGHDRVFRQSLSGVLRDYKVSRPDSLVTVEILGGKKSHKKIDFERIFLELRKSKKPCAIIAEI